MTQPVRKRADQLVVGDRILPAYLPAFSLKSPAEVIFVRVHDYHRGQWVFIAYAHEDGFHDCTSYLPQGEVEVYPASAPVEVVHFDFDDGQSVCGLAPTTPHRASLVWDLGVVSCQDCFDQAPY
jgi:hypothetical protein